MSYMENQISDQIDGGLQEQEDILQSLILSHYELFRRLNQLNNATPNVLNSKALVNAKRINEQLTRIAENEKLVQSGKARKEAQGEQTNKI